MKEQSGFSELPIPFEFFVRLMMDDCGLSRQEAESLVRDTTAKFGVLTTEKPQ